MNLKRVLNKCMSRETDLSFRNSLQDKFVPCTHRYSRWGRPRKASSFIDSRLLAVKRLRTEREIHNISLFNKLENSKLLSHISSCLKMDLWQKTLSFLLNSNPGTSKARIDALLGFLQSYMFVWKDRVTQSILHLMRQESRGFPSSKGGNPHK